MCMFGDQMLRRLKRRDRPAELLAHLRVVDRALQHRLADADQVQRQQRHSGIGDPAQACGGQAVVAQPAAARDRPPRRRRTRCGRRGGPPIIGSGSIRRPAACQWHDEAPVSARRRRRGHDEDVGEVGVRDEVDGTARAASCRTRRRGPAASGRVTGGIARIPQSRCGAEVFRRPARAATPPADLARRAGRWRAPPAWCRARSSGTARGRPPRRRRPRSDSVPPAPPYSAGVEQAEHAGVGQRLPQSVGHGPGPASRSSRTRLVGHSAASSADSIEARSRSSSIG